MSHSYSDIADSYAMRRRIALILEKKAIEAKEEEKRQQKEQEQILECQLKIQDIITELKAEPDLSSCFSEPIEDDKIQKIEDIKKELVEWQKLHILIQLKKNIQKDSTDAHSLSLLTLYTADALLTMDASFSQEEMKRRAIILSVLAVIILAAFPITFSMLAFTHGSLLGVGIELANVLCSKIEGIFGFFTGMKTSNGACRQSFSRIDAVQTSLEKRSHLSSHQKCLLALKKAPIENQQEKEKKNDEMLISNQDLLSRAHQRLCSFSGDQEVLQIIKSDFEIIKGEAKKLIEETNAATPQDQADWVELLPYLIRFSEDHLNINAINALDQKAKEIWIRAEARQKQETARKIAKVMLLASLALTIVCIATILIAMAFYGAVATSGIVVVAHGLIYLSKAMFWLSSIPAAGGSIDAKHYQNTTNKPIDVRPEKMEKLTSLQKISFYSKEIAYNHARPQAQAQAQRSQTKLVSMERTPSLLSSAA